MERTCNVLDVSRTGFCSSSSSPSVAHQADEFCTSSSLASPPPPPPFPPLSPPQSAADANKKTVSLTWQLPCGLHFRPNRRKCVWAHGFRKHRASSSQGGEDPSTAAGEDREKLHRHRVCPVLGAITWVCYCLFKLIIIISSRPFHTSLNTYPIHTYRAVPLSLACTRPN